MTSDRGNQSLARTEHNRTNLIVHSSLRSQWPPLLPRKRDTHHGDKSSDTFVIHDREGLRESSLRSGRDDQGADAPKNPHENLRLKEPFIPNNYPNAWLGIEEPQNTAVDPEPTVPTYVNPVDYPDPPTTPIWWYRFDHLSNQWWATQSDAVFRRACPSVRFVVRAQGFQRDSDCFWSVAAPRTDPFFLIRWVPSSFGTCLLVFTGIATK